MNTNYKKFLENNKIYYQIIAPKGYSIFDTVCVSIEDAKMLCAMIDRIIAELEHFKSFIESLKEEEQKRITEEREKSLKRFLEELQKISEERRKQLLEEMANNMEKFWKFYYEKLPVVFDENRNYTWTNFILDLQKKLYGVEVEEEFISPRF